MTRRLSFVAILASLGSLAALGCSSDGNEENAAGGGSGGEQATAGSAGQSGNSGESGAFGGSGAGTAGTSDSGGAAGSGDAGERPYAHVVAVTTSGEEQDFRFSVSIESADIDCSQFADWWEVLSEDGALLYRRILEHSHTDENGSSDADAPGNTFTRSGGPISVAADTVVIVRAHMSNLDGYNGRVMRGSVATGFTDAPEITADFAADVEDDAPQPTSCAF